MAWLPTIAGLFVMAAIAVVAWRGKKHRIAMSREEVAAAIQKFLDGSGSAWEWDDFISFSLEDPELDRIRIRCAHLSKEFPATKGYCGPEGVDVLRNYVVELRDKSASQAAGGCGRDHEPPSLAGRR